MRRKKDSVNLCALEKFFYDEATLHINTQFKALDVYNWFSSPFRMTVKELFREKLEREEAGEKFEFSIRDFIYPNADRYNSIYVHAVDLAYIDFLRKFHKSKNF